MVYKNKALLNSRNFQGPFREFPTVSRTCLKCMVHKGKACLIQGPLWELSTILRTCLKNMVHKGEALIQGLQGSIRETPKLFKDYKFMKIDDLNFKIGVLKC